MATLKGAGGYVAEVRPFGPTEAELREGRSRLRNSVLEPWLKDDAYRWLRFRVVPTPSSKGDGERRDPRAFEATLYDYAQQRTISVLGSLDDIEAARVTASARQPIPTLDEFRAAVDVVRRDATFGRAVRSGGLRVYRPMPPFVAEPLPDGRSRRLVTVGLFGPKQTSGLALVPDAPVHQFVGVDLFTDEVTVIGPLPGEEVMQCGAPIGADDCPPGSLNGRADITVTAPDGSEIWSLRVIRPGESSGTNGSGIELLDVRYRGIKVLFQAHVPILNVEYQGATPSCGPTFRDWLDEECCFVAVGVDVGEGFRLCSSRPRTIFESGTDEGDFRGVAIFFEGNDLLLVSELQAGWYRYVMEWRLQSDGTILPGLAFAAVANPCTCQHHVHHAYWRLDFDVDGPADNRVQEFNDPPLVPLTPKWMSLLFEVSRTRDASRGRKWAVRDIFTGRSYTIVPGPNDGTADLYGGSDAWFLVADDDEIDDGQDFTSNRLLSRERIDLFANGEGLEQRDVVVWYAVHLDHDLGHSNDGGFMTGPRLVSSWSENIPEPTTTTTTTTEPTTTTTTEPTTTTTTEPTTTTTTTRRRDGDHDHGRGGGDDPECDD